MSARADPRGGRSANGCPYRDPTRPLQPAVRVNAHSQFENLRPAKKRLSRLGWALGGRNSSRVDRIIRRWEYAAQILESLRFIAVHGPDLEGLELELDE